MTKPLTHPPSDTRALPASQRGAEIIDLVTRAGGSMRIQSIAEALNVSEETVRRNVRRLSDEGLVRKVHGGVLLQHGSTELNFAQRMAENPIPKQRIAAHVAGLIGDGSSLFLDVGSTTAFIAEALKAHQELLVVKELEDGIMMPLVILLRPDQVEPLYSTIQTILVII